MKTLKITLALFFVIFIFFSCNKKENKNQDSNLSANVTSDDRLLAHIPIPAKLDSAMRQNFDTITYKVLKSINPKNVKSFNASKANYLKMIDNFPASSDRVAFSFVQFNKSKFSGKYTELNKYDGCLYLIYYYMDANGKNVGNKAYAMLGIQNTLEISAADLQTMENDYVSNIKPKIDKFVTGSQGNTLRVKINKDELLAYKNRIATKSNVRNFKIVLAQWVDYKNFIDNTDRGRFTNKFSQFSDNSVGQLTFVTDSQNSTGSNVQGLSGFDLSSFCPEDCP